MGKKELTFCSTSPCQSQIECRQRAVQSFCHRNVPRVVSGQVEAQGPYAIGNTVRRGKGSTCNLCKLGHRARLWRSGRVEILPSLSRRRSAFTVVSANSSSGAIEGLLFRLWSPPIEPSAGRVGPALARISADESTNYRQRSVRVPGIKNCGYRNINPVGLLPLAHFSDPLGCRRAGSDPLQFARVGTAAWTSVGGLHAPPIRRALPRERS